MKQAFLSLNTMKRKLLATFLGVGSICSVQGQWTPTTGTPQQYIHANPIYVHGTSTNGLYVGKGVSGGYNLAIGGTLAIANAFPLNSLLPGVHFNTAVGVSSLRLLTTGTDNVSLGHRAIENLQLGIGNVGIGSMCMNNLNSTVTTGNNTASGNTAVGASAMLGSPGQTTGNRNSAFGGASLQSITSGILNTAVGHSALFSNTTGSQNTAMGNNSLSNLISGSNNVAIGFYALSSSSPGIGLSSGINNVGIGAASMVPSTTGSNQLSIQNTIYGINMQGGTTGNVSIGVQPTAIPAGSTFAGAFARLKLGGVNTGTPANSTPSLQLDYVPTYTGTLPVPNPSGGSGNYLFIDQAGVVRQAQVPIGTGGVNIYTNDGTITTTATNREVIMNNKNIWFNTATSPTGGRIYIGSNILAGPGFPNPGISDPYKLFVEGGILTEKVKVAARGGVNWADYVFADDYKLMPLNKLEAFVKENKHLPGIESAEELVKNGLDLGDMQAKQMEKIEELTLYIIEQNKMLEKQNTEIEALKAQMKILLEKSK